MFLPLFACSFYLAADWIIAWNVGARRVGRRAVYRRPTGPWRTDHRRWRPMTSPAPTHYTRCRKRSLRPMSQLTILHSANVEIEVVLLKEEEKEE